MADGGVVAREAEFWRAEGKTCFQEARLGAAITCYTKAIALCPDVAVYWVNRGLCHLRRKNWSKVEEDSRKALALDNASVKGHYLLGRALFEKEDYALADREFDKAFNLLKSSSSVDEMANEIQEILAKAKYLHWKKLSTERVSKMESLSETCENALLEHHFARTTLVEDSAGTTNDHSEQFKLLSEVFKKAILDNTPEEVPDYLSCQISFEIFSDPVITPSGVTYERGTLLDHLRKVGCFDPVTRAPLEEHQLVPNLAIKKAVQAYLKEHGWAYNSN
ncbi:unnamed protein product [Alopecurus aequalis]